MVFKRNEATATNYGRQFIMHSDKCEHVLPYVCEMRSPALTPAADLVPSAGDADYMPADNVINTSLSDIEDTELNISFLRQSFATFSGTLLIC